MMIFYHISLFYINVRGFHSLNFVCPISLHEWVLARVKHKFNKALFWYF